MNIEDQKGRFMFSRRRVKSAMTSGQDVPDNEPDLVIKEILQVLEATQKW